MCGIAGLVAHDELPRDAIARAVTMRDTMVHRGPDEAGLWSDRHAVLAHRRLSIVDLSRGQQPLPNETSTILVTYNGEIYNHAELAGLLRAAGHQYRTACDTETIVHAYEEWGDEAVQRFRGMFAFGLWDAPRRRLLLVRDRLGIKPLYWARVGDRLLFASEIKAILASGLIEPRAREELLPELLSTRAVAGDGTLFHGVHKLPPGHLLTFEDGRVAVRSYWDLPIARHGQAVRRTTTAGVAGEFRARLEESIRLRLMADVPLGVFLSGGIDSSAIAMLMSGMVDRPIQTFSVAFAERAFNELSYSRAVAAAIGAEVHEVVIDDHDFFDALPKLIWHEDEPLAHPSSVPLYFVSALASQHVKVVLTGEGSDELLAGYGRYPRAVWNWWAGTAYERAIPVAAREWMAREVVPTVGGRLGRYARRSFLAMPRTAGAMLFDNFSAIRLGEQRRLFEARLARLATSGHAFSAALAHFHGLSADATLLDRLLYTDIKTYLVELLMKQDQMSMAASIESRVPFLDHELVEFVATLPDAWKLRGWNTKRVLRESMRGRLPDAVVRRSKMGFPVPFANWLRGGWSEVVRDVLLDRRARQRGLFVGDAIERLLQAHESGREDASTQLWSLLTLELWYRTFIDGGGRQQLARPAAARQPSRTELAGAASA